MTEQIDRDVAKQMAIRSTERLHEFMIAGVGMEKWVGREWVILWRHLTAAYGDDFFERSERQMEIDHADFEEAN